MKNANKKTKIVILAAGAFLTMAFVSIQTREAVVSKEIPEEYKTMENPFRGDESLNRLGLRTYNRHCKSCHGTEGFGDGVMSKNLEKHPGDLTKPEFHEHSDGEIFYLSFYGSELKPDFDNLLNDEEARWAAINYVRTLKKEE